MLCISQHYQYRSPDKQRRDTSNTNTPLHCNKCVSVFVCVYVHVCVCMSMYA